MRCPLRLRYAPASGHESSLRQRSVLIVYMIPYFSNHIQFIYCVLLVREYKMITNKNNIPRSSARFNKTDVNRRRCSASFAKNLGWKIRNMESFQHVFSGLGSDSR